MKTFATIKKKCNVRSTSLGLKTFVTVVVPTVTFGMETLGLGKEVRHKLNVMEIKCQ